MRLVAATILVLGAVFPFASGAASAHHSFASQFDDRVVTLHGAIAGGDKWCGATIASGSAIWISKALTRA